MTTTHIGKMLAAAPAARLPGDGVEETQHHGSQAWAVRFKGAVIGLIFGDRAEAEGHLCLLQGKEVPADVLKRIQARRTLMAAMFKGAM